MGSVDWKPTAFFVLLFVLGTMMDALVRASLSRVPTRNPISWTGILLGSAFVAVAGLYALYNAIIPSSISTPPGTSSSSDALGIFSLVVGIIAVVLTILTGLSITGAWRAIDDADRATKKIDEVAKSNRKASADSLRLAAYIEAIDRLGSARSLPHMHLESVYRGELASAFSRRDTVAVLDHLGDLMSNKAIISEIGDLGARFLHAIATDESGLSMKQKSTLHAILSILEAHNRS